MLHEKKPVSSPPIGAEACGKEAADGVIIREEVPNEAKP